MIYRLNLAGTGLGPGSSGDSLRISIDEPKVGSDRRIERQLRP